MATGIPVAREHSDTMDVEKHEEEGQEAINDDEAPKLFAQRGHAATDKYGRVLVHFDPAEKHVFDARLTGLFVR